MIGERFEVEIPEHLPARPMLVELATCLRMAQLGDPKPLREWAIWARGYIMGLELRPDARPTVTVDGRLDGLRMVADVGPWRRRWERVRLGCRQAWDVVCHGWRQ